MKTADITNVHCLNVRCRIWLLVLYTFIHTHTHTHIYIYIHTHICVCVCACVEFKNTLQVDSERLTNFLISLFYCVFFLNRKT